MSRAGNDSDVAWQSAFEHHRRADVVEQTAQIRHFRVLAAGASDFLCPEASAEPVSPCGAASSL